jgi:processive 1,2-diacylglycerol beta-glucosyltransferase
VKQPHDPPAREGEPVKRVLILAVRFGSGHWQAALALKRALVEAHPGIKVEVVNYLKFVGSLFDIILRSIYQDLVIRMPPVYRRFFSYTDRLSQDSLFQKLMKTTGLPAFLLYVKRKRPDLIISTYPVPSAVTSWMKRRGLINCPLVTVITDFIVHQMWIQPGTDLYIAASESVAGELARRGVPSGRVAVTGIPIDPRIARREDESRPGERHRWLSARALSGVAPGLSEELQDLPLVLVISGATGFGGDLTRICHLLAGLAVPHVAVVLGVRFPRLRLNLSRAVSKGPNRVFIVGYTREMPLFMAAASCLISKAGGLTISEALAAEVPLIIYRALPGQEEMNRDFLTREGVALSARNLDELGQLLCDVLRNEGLRLRMRDAAARLKHPDSAREAAKVIFSMLDVQGPALDEKSKDIEV